MLERRNHRRSTRFRVESSSSSSDEEEDEDDDKDNAIGSSYSNEQSISLDLGESNAAEYNFKRDRSTAVNHSLATRTPSPKRRSTNLTTSTPSTTHNTTVESFEQTHISSNEPSIQNDSSVVNLTKDMSIIQLDDSDFVPVGSNGPKSSLSGASKKLVQPKLSFGKKMSLGADLAKLRDDLKATEDLYEKFKNTLPDKGANLKKSIMSFKNKSEKNNSRSSNILLLIRSH